ncbi:MAG: selenocysteine-specific translation elongation factor, partial [Myxococcota bacterium]
MNARPLVVGTAGHIDHGKTSLVRTLTGVDLDDLPEERARGITIALGFTALPLPDGRFASFVDVPGHEKLVRTMVAGATGLDAVVLCVSAVDGAMPQTREHVAILDLLGLRRGVIALTMADLVDDELLALAVDDVTQLVAGTFLAGAPIIPFSAIDGRGKDALVRAIAEFPDTDRAPNGPFRLPIDRVFVRTGFGVVVTGTTTSGTIEDGDVVTLLPSGVSARVRGIEVHGHEVARATPGHRTALNLAGVDAETVSRGMVAARGPVPCASIVDLSLSALTSAPPLEDGAAVRVLHGTAELGARVYLIGPDAPE